MSILTDYYKIAETPPTSGVELDTPTVKFFSFDFNNLTSEENDNTTVFWNFGDPYSTENELIVSTTANSMIRHVFTYSGTYHIHCIANINGVPFHVEKDITIDNNNINPYAFLFTDGTPQLYSDNTEVTYA